MAHNEFKFLTTDGLRLFGQSWLPEKEVHYIICIVHGLGDHSGRYEHYARFMNENGVGVFTMDLRGHGKSEGKRGHSPSFSSYYSDIELLLIEVRQKFEDVPVFIFGHSLGGDIVLNFLLRHKSKEVTGAIISAPWLRLAFEPPKSKTAPAKMLSKILPTLSFGNEIDPMDLSKDPEVGQAYMQDPQVHKKITARLYISASEAGKWALDNAHLLRYPVFIYHGDDDRRTSWEASKEFADKAGNLAEFRLWKSLRHEPHNEKEQKEVLQAEVDWIKRITNKES